MNEDVRQTLSYILHERMKAKATLDALRLLEEVNKWNRKNKQS